MAANGNTCTNFIAMIAVEEDVSAAANSAGTGFTLVCVHDMNRESVISTTIPSIERCASTTKQGGANTATNVATITHNSIVVCDPA